MNIYWGWIPRELTDSLLRWGEPECLPEGPEVTRMCVPKAETVDAVEHLLKKREADGLCRPGDVILLHVRKEL